MYVPEYNRVEDRAVSLAFMQANPFAILTSHAENGPFATHLPLLAQEAGGQVMLRGHFAKANPHWQIMQQEEESLVIFHGPHAYVSPSLYEAVESVPTWNYAAVHVYGKGRILEDEAESKQVLHQLISCFDPSYQSQWLSLSNEYQARMLRHIVAFEIAVTRVEAKFKLSQNRPRTDQESVIRALESSSDSNAAGVARLMRQRGLGLR